MDLLDVYIVVYFNNILIYSNNMSLYKNHIKKILWWLWKTRLYMKAEKYEFYSDYIEYLEYTLFLSKLSISSNKIKTIQNWPESRKIKDVQVFLGFTNFYYKFIYNYSNIAAPLIWLTRKNTTWNFDFCYEVFIPALILIYWISNAQMIVETNALEYILTAIFSIMIKEKKIHLAIFYSCLFKIIELNYDIYNKELLVVFEVFHT